MKERTIPTIKGVFADKRKLLRLIELMDQHKSRGEIPRILSQEFNCVINTNHVSGVRGRLKRLWRKEGSLIEPEKAKPNSPRTPRTPKSVRVRKKAEAERSEGAAPKPDASSEPSAQAAPPPSSPVAEEVEVDARFQNQRLYRLTPESALAWASMQQYRPKCQWVEGDARNRSFCPKDAKNGSYCEDHKKIMHGPPPQEKRKRGRGSVSGATVYR